jgi:GTP-binding protein
MAFVDELTIHLKAGDGGDGVVRWLHLKYDEYSGPSGGDGGKGGDVFIRGVRDMSILLGYRNLKSFAAKDGEPGGNNSCHGARGADFTLDLPIGSRVTNLETQEVFEINHEGETIMVLRGGGGGLGNEHFKSSTNIRPEESTPGRPGQEADFHIELRLFADVGFVGLPSAGKTSLLNSLTNTKAKVAAYHFTTLEPNLGSLHGIILADIPGLIEGASEGKGLGHKFLRHIERTRVLAHCVGLDSEDPLKDYQTVRAELEAYSPELAQKPEIIVLTKSDLVDESGLAATKKIFEGIRDTVVSVSILDDKALKDLSELFTKVAQEIDQTREE